MNSSGRITEHTHPPSQTEVEATKVKANIKSKAETTTETSQQILWTELRNVSEGAAANLLSLGSLRRNIGRAREDRNMPPNPQLWGEIQVLPRQYQLTANGDEFLVFDSGVGDPERIFIFCVRARSPIPVGIGALICRWNL